VILVSPKRATDRRLINALKPLGGSIDVKAMQAANYAVDRDVGKKSPTEAARLLAR
jgi:osmoprotectant transport system permease protein